MHARRPSSLAARLPSSARVRVAVIRATSSRALLIGLLLLAIAWYVVAANAYVGASYALTAAEESRGALQEEVARLESQVMSSAMLEAVDAQARGLGFVPVDRPQYLAIPGDAVARK